MRPAAPERQRVDTVPEDVGEGVDVRKVRPDHEGGHGEGPAPERTGLGDGRAGKRVAEVVQRSGISAQTWQEPSPRFSR